MGCFLHTTILRKSSQKTSPARTISFIGYNGCNPNTITRILQDNNSSSMLKIKLPALLPVLFLAACSAGDKQFDAEGVFEADEVIVSSEVGGKLLTLTPDEGSTLVKDSLVAIIDSIPLRLQKQQ